MVHIIWGFGFEVEGLKLRVQGLRSGGWGSGFRVLGLGLVRCWGLVLSVYVLARFEAKGFWFLVSGLRFRFQGLGIGSRVQVTGFRFLGSGFRIES